MKPRRSLLRSENELQVSVTNMTVEPEVSKKTEESLYEKVCGYSLMWWDGLGFFGFATSKLGRLKGEPVTFWT